MKSLPIGFFLVAVSFLSISTPAYATQLTCPESFDLNVPRLHSKKHENLCELFANKKAVLIVNTASHCGFTKQFEGLEALYKKHQKQGLIILGFPSNSFFQEESSEEGTANVCFKNYGVTFPMFTHVKVKGKDAHPVFRYLTEKSSKPSWNFNKYLITEGKVTHFGSKVAPQDSELEKAIAAATARPAHKTSP